jgi:hypothetical protein
MRMGRVFFSFLRAGGGEEWAGRGAVSCRRLRLRIRAGLEKEDGEVVLVFFEGVQVFFMSGKSARYSVEGNVRCCWSREGSEETTGATGWRSNGEEKFC